MDSGELIELFYNRTYEKFVNKQILDDKNYIVPRQQLTNYVRELVNIPFIDFIEYIKNNPFEQKIKASDITQFSSFSSCEIEMCNALIWANNPGCQYVDIGRFFPESVASSTEGAYRKYGENHIKAASQLGLVFEYYDFWYLSCLGYIYPDLDFRVRRQLLARTILRNLLYQKMLLDVMNHNIRPESYMEMLSDITIKRRINNVCTFLNLCIEECKEQNVKVFSIVRQKAKERTDIINRYSTNDISRNQRFLSDFSTNLSYSKFNNRELFKKYKEGDEKAYQEIVLRHQRLVVIIARLYEKKGYILDDLIQEGNIGLIKAIQHFDYFRKVPFTEYAKSWIFQSTSDAIAKQSFIVRLPLNQLSNYRKVKTYIHKFEEQNGYLPSISDIEGELFLDANLIAYFYQLPSDLKDMTCLMDDMDCFESKEQLDENFENKDYAKFQVYNLLRILPKKHSQMIRRFYGISTGEKGESLAEIGEHYGLTRERVRQIVDSSIKKMRESAMGNNKVEDNSENFSDNSEFRINKKEKVKDIIERVKQSSSYNKETIAPNNIKSNYDEDDIIQREIEQKKHERRYEVNTLNDVSVGDVILYRDKLCSVTKIIVMGDTSRLGIEYENGVLDTIQNDKSKYKILQHSTKNKDTRKEVKELRTSQTKKYNIERKIEFPFLPLQFPQEEKKEKKEKYPKSESNLSLSTSLSYLVKQKIITKKQLKHCHKKGLWTIGHVKQIIEKYHLTPDSTRFTKYTLDMWFSIIDLLKKNEDGIEHVFVDIPSAAPYTETELPTLGTDDTEVEE